MTDTTPPTIIQSPSPSSGMKIVFVGIVLILIAGVFVLVNSRPSGSAGPIGFSVTADKSDATYYDFEMPIFRVEGARPGSTVIAELVHDGKTVARTASGVTIDAAGQGLIRGDLVTDENSGQYRGSWTVKVRGQDGEEATADYTIVSGCSDSSEPEITTDKKEYRVGEEIRYGVKGPRNTQVRWFGLAGRDREALNLNESNAYYGDVTDGSGEWESSSITATIADANASEAVVSSIITLCDKTAQVKVTVRR